MAVVGDIQSFLLELQEGYGFQMDVGRLAHALTCANSITDVEEVFYRLKALVCSTEEQCETFATLFGIRFLGKKMPQQTELPKGKKKKNNPEEVARRLEIQLRQNERHMRDIKKKLCEDEAELQRHKEELKSPPDLKPIDDQISSAKADLLKLQQKSRRAETEYEQFVKDAVFTAKSMKKCPNAIKKCASTCKEFASKKIRLQIALAVFSGKYSSEITKTIKSLMDLAATMRTQKNMQAFKACVDLISELSKAKPNKKEFPESLRLQADKLKKAAADAKKSVADTEQRISRLNAKRADKKMQYGSLKNKVQNLELRVKTRDEKLKNAQKRQIDLAKQKALQEQFAERQRDSQIANTGGIIVKDISQNSRKVFGQGMRSVISLKEADRLMSISLKSMSKDEKDNVMQYIRTNARQFRNTIRRKSRTAQKRQIDVRETVIAAAKTDGEPIRICYQKPRKSHAKIVCLADISGSCRGTSSLALYFMGLMGDAFPCGCKKYVFVNSLISVDRFFANRSVDEAVETVGKVVPSKGVYSDYGTTIHELRKEAAGSIHSDTTVIIIGDARNNSLRAYDEDLQYIANKAANVFWLETDEPEKWDQGDSIIGLYEKAGANVYHVATAGDLINFLCSVR